MSTAGLEPMLTIGIDLAARAERTAIAAIRWADVGTAGVGTAELVTLRLGATDAEIVDLSAGAASIGIDCPFGWPVEFVEYVVAHSRGDRLPGDLRGDDRRRRLAYRETDRVVRAVTGRWPLSVSTDRLGLTAMHCAELLDDLGASGIAVDRAGEGVLAEVYPGAALRGWGFDTSGYKTKPDALDRLVDAFRSRTPWLTIDADALTLMRRSTDAFDAVIAAFNARAHALGATTPLPDELRAVARIEGWVALPTIGLEEMRG